MENKKAAPVCETGAANEKEMYAPVKVPESMTAEDAMEFLEVLRFMQEYDYWAPKAYRDSYGKLRERITQTLRTAFSDQETVHPVPELETLRREGRLCAENRELRKTLEERRQQIHQVLAMLEKEERARKIERIGLVCMALIAIVIVCLFAINA